MGILNLEENSLCFILGKVFQSLCGYDFMLLDQNLDEPASETFDALRAAFWEEVCLGLLRVSRSSSSWKNVGNPMETP